MMRFLGALFALLLLAGCQDAPVIVIEDETPDVEHVWHTEHVYHTFVEVIEQTNTVIVEDTTPEIVREYYSDAADLPVLTWEDTGGAPTMPKKTTDLTVATSSTLADIGAIVQTGTSKQITYANLTVKYPQNHIHGLICSPNATDWDADVDIAAGGCRDSADADNMDLAASITKRLDAAWAVGTGNGGLDDGSVAADTMYAIWLIKRSDTGVVDVCFSTSFASPSIDGTPIPVAYDEERLIGAIRTDGTSDIIYFRQSGDYFSYLGDQNTYLPLDVNDTTITSLTFEVGTLSAPPHSVADIVGNLVNTTDTGDRGELIVMPIPRTSPPLALAGDEWVVAGQESNGANFRRVSGQARIAVDASSQVQYSARETGGAATVRIFTAGFLMTTRSEPQ